MMFIFLFILCTVNADGGKEGDKCTKGGLPGVCTNIRKCLAAQQDIENRKEPQVCDFGGVDPIVCCVPPVTTTATERAKGMCVLPPYPQLGDYDTNVLNGKPGDAYDIFFINVTCPSGYIVDGSRSVFCQNGRWTEPMPKCVPACRLMSHPSVEYNCIVSDGIVQDIRVCREYEPSGTVVTPRCRIPLYYSLLPLGLMNCVNGNWNYVAKCNPFVVPRLFDIFSA